MLKVLQKRRGLGIDDLCVFIRSIVNMGSGVINYGWEWLTLELGFLTIFLCPLLPLRWLQKG